MFNLQTTVCCCQPWNSSRCVCTDPKVKVECCLFQRVHPPYHHGSPASRFESNLMRRPELLLYILRWGKSGSYHLMLIMGMGNCLDLRLVGCWVVDEWFIIRQRAERPGRCFVDSRPSASPLCIVSLEFICFKRCVSLTDKTLASAQASAGHGISTSKLVWNYTLLPCLGACVAM